jgi:hypothetical protein
MRRTQDLQKVCPHPDREKGAREPPTVKDV